MDRFAATKKAARKTLEEKLRPEHHQRLFRRTFPLEGEIVVIGEDYSDELVSWYSLLQYDGVSGFILLKDEEDLSTNGVRVAFVRRANEKTGSPNT
jgi:hypothetical protein